MRIGDGLNPLGAHNPFFPGFGQFVFGGFALGKQANSPLY